MNFWWVAPISPQARIAFGRVKQNLTPGTFRSYEHPEPQIRMVTGPILTFKSADNPDSLYGEDVYGAIIDEASRCKADAWYAVRSTLTATRGPAVCIGNVKGKRNWFYEWCRRAQMNMDPNAQFRRITWRDAVEAKVLDEEEIDDARRNLPEKVFQELFEALASDDTGNPFGEEHILACIRSKLSPNPPIAFGIDLAKKQDYLVVIGLDENGDVCVFERWTHVPWRDSIRRIHEIVGDYIPALVDSTGVGDPVLEDLQHDHGNFFGYNFSSGSKQRLMEGLAVSIQSHEIGYPDGPIKNELMLFEYETTRTGVRYSAPEGYHDDCVCLEAGTDIRTARGNVSIEDVCVGDLVLTHLGSYEEVIATGSRESKAIFDLDITGKPKLRLTEEHPLLLAERYHNGAHDSIQNQLSHKEPAWLSLDSGNLFTNYGALSTTIYDITDVESLDLLTTAPDNYLDNNGHLVSTFVRYSRTYINPKTVPVKRFIDVDTNFCTLLGYYVAEGSIGGESHLLQFASHEREEPIRDWLCEYFSSLGLNPTTLKRIDPRFKENNGFTLNVGSKPLANLFKTFGKSRNKFLPSWAEKLPLNKQAAILCGYLLGDGSFTEGMCKAQTISGTLAYQLFEISQRLSIPASLSKRYNDHGPLWGLAWGAPTTKIIMSIIPQDLLDCKIVGIRETQKDQTQIRMLGNYAVGKIRSVTEISDKPRMVYNISVANAQSYIANGTVVHNCSLALARQKWAETAPGANLMEFWDRQIENQRRKDELAELGVPDGIGTEFENAIRAQLDSQETVNSELTEMYNAAFKSRIAPLQRVCISCHQPINSGERVSDGVYSWHVACSGPGQKINLFTGASGAPLQ